MQRNFGGQELKWKKMAPFPGQCEIYYMKSCWEKLQKRGGQATWVIKSCYIEPHTVLQKPKADESA